MPRPKLRTPQLREHVLRNALAILSEGGVPSFTTRRVAEASGTSLPALYELFGDRSGLLRAVFFEGFRMLGARLAEGSGTGSDTGSTAGRRSGAARPSSVAVAGPDPREDLRTAIRTFRVFAKENGVLFELMFSLPFTDFEPGAADEAAGAVVRGFLVEKVRACVDAGAIAGDPKDVAHVLLAMVQGLAAQERAGWLGSGKASVERRWDLALRIVLQEAVAPSAPKRRAKAPPSKA